MNVANLNTPETVAKAMLNAAVDKQRCAPVGASMFCYFESDVNDHVLRCTAPMAARNDCLPDKPRKSGLTPTGKALLPIFKLPRCCEMSSFQKHLGVMGSNPKTGECFAAFMDAPAGEDLRYLMQSGSLLEKEELEAIKDAFCVSHASRQIRLYGPSIGRYMGQDIPEWHERADGRRYHYTGVCGLHPDFKSLAPGQVVVGPGLIYQLSSGSLRNLPC